MRWIRATRHSRCTRSAPRALATSLVKLKTRLELSRAKHRSLAGHARMSRRVAALVPFYEYDEDALLPLRRRARRGRRAAPRPASCGWPRSTRRASPKTDRADRRGRATASPTCSSPTPTGCRSSTAAIVREHLQAGAFLQSSAGVTVTDLDGNGFYDLTGSYGVNLFGYDFYKECIDARRRARRASSGPVLGAYHPVVADNVRAPARDLRARRGVVPHVRHRGGDAGGAARALSHAAARIWCASAAPITAGGATCSPASAIRCRRARPTR